MTTINERNVRNAIASMWWIPLVQGIASILFGFYAFTRTGQTIAAIIVILGVYWIINGLFAVASAIMGKTKQSRLWQLLSGGLSILAGLFAVSHPLISGTVTATFIGTFIGISAVFSGVAQMLAGREVAGWIGSEAEWSWSGFFLGLLNLIFGLIILGSPVFTFALFIRILAFWAIIGGLGLLFAAYRIRSLRI